MMQVCDISMSLTGSVKMTFCLGEAGEGAVGTRTSRKTLFEKKRNLILIVELMFGLSHTSHMCTTEQNQAAQFCSKQTFFHFFFV